MDKFKVGDVVEYDDGVYKIIECEEVDWSYESQCKLKYINSDNFKLPIGVSKLTLIKPLTKADLKDNHIVEFENNNRTTGDDVVKRNFNNDLTFSYKSKRKRHHKSL